LVYTIDNYDNKIRSITSENMEQNNMGSEDAAQSSAYVIFDSRLISPLMDLDNCLYIYYNVESDWR